MHECEQLEPFQMKYSNRSTRHTTLVLVFNLLRLYSKSKKLWPPTPSLTPQSLNGREWKVQKQRVVDSTNDFMRPRRDVPPADWLTGRSKGTRNILRNLSKNRRFR